MYPDLAFFLPSQFFSPLRDFQDKRFQVLQFGANGDTMIWPSLKQVVMNRHIVLVGSSTYFHFGQHGARSSGLQAPYRFQPDIVKWQRR